MYKKVAQKCSAKEYFVKCTISLCILLTADEFEMSLDEFYMKSTNHAPPSSAFSNSNPNGDEAEKNNVSNAAKYRQFEVIGEDSLATVKDSIHLDWSPLNPDTPEAGVTVKMWDSFAHRLLWQQTWPRAVAFQPLSTRYETNRPDSPIEGFLFRIWQWKSDVRDTFTAAREKRAKVSIVKSMNMHQITLRKSLILLLLRLKRHAAVSFPKCCLQKVSLQIQN